VVELGERVGGEPEVEGCELSVWSLSTHAHTLTDRSILAIERQAVDVQVGIRWRYRVLYGFGQVVGGAQRVHPIVVGEWVEPSERIGERLRVPELFSCPAVLGTERPVIDINTIALSLLTGDIAPMADTIELPANRDQTIRRIQEALASTGDYEGAIDGDPYTGTAEAAEQLARSFRAANELLAAAVTDDDNRDARAFRTIRDLILGNDRELVQVDDEEAG